jgi:hypothetical protein
MDMKLSSIPDRLKIPKSSRVMSSLILLLPIKNRASNSLMISDKTGSLRLETITRPVWVRRADDITKEEKECNSLKTASRSFFISLETIF